MGDNIVGRHAGSSEWVDHEDMILRAGRVIVNSIVGLRLNGRAFQQRMTTENPP